MLYPRQQQCRVKRGDTLWSIAQHEYGDPTAWPEIAKANRIPDGNLILIGMNLRLPPILSTHQGHAGPGGSQAIPSSPIGPPKPLGFGRGLNGSQIGPARCGSVPLHPTLAPYLSPYGASVANLPTAQAVLFPATKYKLDDLPAMTIFTPQADIKLRLIGEISVQPKGAMAEIEFSKSGGLSDKLKAEYDSKVARFAGQVNVKWNNALGVAEMSCGFTLATKINGREFVSHQVVFTPPNRYKYTLKPKDISGEVDGMLFKGSLGYELEIALKNQDGSASAIPVPAPAWNLPVGWITVGVLTALGVAIIVADLAKDVATLGAGLAETPLSWSAAMALFSQAAAAAH